jgi:hypothetical protein
LSKKTLIITGDPEKGKTQYAKSFFNNPLVVGHIDKLKEFEPHIHDGIIFNDMNFSHWPRTSCIHLLDNEEDADINVKCSMITIPAGVKRIIVTNEKTKDIFPCFDRAISRRITEFKVNYDLRLGYED